MNIFNKSFSLIFDIKRIHLDKENTIYNLQGSIFLNDNEITKLNLVSEFNDNKQIKMTQKDDNERLQLYFQIKLDH